MPRRARAEAEQTLQRSAVPAVDAANDPTLREIAAVKAMRRALASDPARLLELAAVAEQEFGRGMFAEERAALRVFALAHTDAARSRAAARSFLREFGAGPFAAKVQQIVDGGEGPLAEAQ